MDSLTQAPVVSKPLPESNVLISSAQISDSVEGDPHSKPKPTLGTVFLLMGVFVFVSIMIGTLLWILNHEISKNRNKSQIYVIWNHELGIRNYEEI